MGAAVYIDPHTLNRGTDAAGTLEAELIVAKRRRGRGADIATVYFDGGFTRFSELADD